MSDTVPQPSPVAEDVAGQPPVVDEPVGQSPKPVAALMDVMDVLRKLVNESPNVITDVNGKTYKLPAQLSTKAMFRLGKAIRELYDMFDGQAQARIEAEGVWLGKLRVIADVIMSDEAYLQAAEHAFTIAHPKVAADAVAAIKATLGDDTEVTVADCFSLEELFGVGLVPFLLRPATRLWGVAETAGVTKAGQ